MADNDNKDTVQTETDDKKTPDTPTFNESQQAFIDQLISDRLTRARTSWQKEKADEDAKRAESERIAKLDGEEKLKAEYDQQLREVKDKLKASESALRLSEARSELASNGLDVSFADLVVRDTLEDTQKVIAALKSQVDKEVARTINAQSAKGTPKASNAEGGNDSVYDAIMRGAGVKK